jgi:hypothetical protein
MKFNVCVVAILTLSCAEQSTNINGLRYSASSVLPVGTSFRFTYSQTETGNASTPSGTFGDEVVNNDVDDPTSIVFQTSTPGLKLFLNTIKNRLSYSGPRLLTRLAIRLQDHPLQDHTVDIGQDDDAGVTVRDTVLRSNGLFVADGKFVEHSWFVGNGEANVAGFQYPIREYRVVHDLFDTLQSPAAELDTIEVDYAPDLGYFTRLRDTRYLLGGVSFGIVKIEARLDSIVRPR